VGAERSVGFSSRDLLAACEAAVAASEKLLQRATAAVAGMVRGADGAVAAAALERDQFAAHGLAWLATYVEAVRQGTRWAVALEAEGRLGEVERLILQIAVGEYLNQMAGGIPLSQGEMARPADMGLDAAALADFRLGPVARLMAEGNTAAARARLGRHLADAHGGGAFGDAGLDETLGMAQDQFRRFAETRVKPFAHDWHRRDELIPLPVVSELAGLGVFGLTTPEEYGGMGLSKSAMCVVTEELSRASLGVGSLGTRSEIAGELILRHGTAEQKRRFLPGIASGDILPTAVFTEPGTGSDLGSLRTRAVKNGGVYRVTGNKTWITHGARSDLMTLLARTDPNSRDHRGLTMFLAEKPRGTDADPFPAPGMSGGEIKVLGYRGMKEYEIAFDGFVVAEDAVLGGREGEGFKQLMATFESARIQTAARALGVAQSALDLALGYALERAAFGKPIFSFPRVHGKIAWMAAETMLARQLTHHAARAKDAGKRCDLEAGMAKLLAARVAWAAADNAVQIHGGNGYAEEYPVSRVLCDARILNIFEGAAEIQAQVIARRLLEQAN
jgi:(2S)-methylsuccinyl-CoA dehydrogenase